MVLLKLFLVFLKISFCAIGGAYSFLPLLQREIVENYQWLTEEEFLAVLGVVKIFPGAISIKYATYVGYKVAGFPGLLATNLGNLIGPAVLILIASRIYFQYRDSIRVESAFKMIQFAVFSMLIAMALQLISIGELRHVNAAGLAIMVASFLIFYFTKAHPVFIILGAGLMGAFLVT